MKKFLIVYICGTGLFLSNSALANEEIAVGEASYFLTHSKVANIIGQKSAELEALKDALSEVVDLCGGENFEVRSIEYSISSPNPPMSAIAEVEYECL